MKFEEKNEYKLWNSSTEELVSKDAAVYVPKGKVYNRRKSSLVTTANENLEKMEIDYLHFTGLTNKDAYLFTHVQYVCLGGCQSRMEKFSYEMAKVLGL